MMENIQRNLRIVEKLWSNLREISSSPEGVGELTLTLKIIFVPMHYRDVLTKLMAKNWPQKTKIFENFKKIWKNLNIDG